MSNLKQLFDQYATFEAGHRFQSEFAKFVASNPHNIVVETGAGISTLFLLKEINDGKLFSIDPNAWCNFEVEHHNYELIKKQSINAMLDLYLRTGAWDVFIHDGKHEIKDMTYEFEFAYACLNSGGYIASDDYTFGNHNAWQTFLANHDLKSFKMGDIEIAQKPSYIPVFDNIERYHLECLKVAENAEEMFLLKGGKLSDVEWVKQ